MLGMCSTNNNTFVTGHRKFTMQPTQNDYRDEEAHHTIQKKCHGFPLVQDLHECANVVCTQQQYSTLI